LSADPRSNRKVLSLYGLLILQGLCAAFFLFDAVVDLIGLDHENGATDTFEFVIVIALIVSLIFSARELRRTRWRQQVMEQQIKVASGAFSKLLNEHFDEWALTPSERDVAMLAIKGLSIAEIAAIRETKDGTIKAQCNAIYRKAGVKGRTQLVSQFIEELMAGDSLLEGEPVV